jgi:hypothetical protein
VAVLQTREKGAGAAKAASRRPRPTRVIDLSAKDALLRD